MAARVVPIVVLAFVGLVAAPAAGAPYLQDLVDAARTGSSTDPGPTTLDVALTVKLESGPGWGAPPLILNGSVYVLTHAVPAIPGLSVNGLHRIDLDTALVEVLIPLDGSPSSLASDGERLYLAEAERIAAYDVSGAGPLWTWDFPTLVPAPEVENVCAPLAVYSGTVYAACSQRPPLAAVQQAPAFPLDPPGSLDVSVGDPGSGAVVAVALEATTGGEKWRFVDGPLPEDIGPPDPGAAPRIDGTGPTATGIAVTDAYVLVAIHDSSRPEEAFVGGTVRRTIYFFERETGTWVGQYDEGDNVNLANVGTAYQSPYRPPPAMTGDVTTLYLKLDPVVAYDADTLAVRWGRAVGEPDPDARPDEVTGTYGGNALALTSDALFVASYYSIARLSTEDGSVVWQTRVAEMSTTPGILAAAGRLYVAGWISPLWVVDQTTGVRLETVDYETVRVPGEVQAVRYGLGEGVLVLQLGTGEVRVLGTTGAAIQPRWTLTSAYPAPGEMLALDLSESSPGAQAPDLEFRVSWGDGTAQDWTSAPTFSHAYDAAGPKEIEVALRNGANQTATLLIPVDVGGTPPVELNALQRALSRENQDLTFGVLGVALALGGGLFAIAHRHTRRRRVQRELDTIEKTFAATRDRPAECETALAERRARVRGLGLDGKLDQAEVLLLERRLDEMGQALRLGSIETQFPFLSVGMARTLRDMLADGRIVAWEREHFLRALDEDGHMTAAQKKKVRRQIEAWFARDAGGGRA